MAWTYTVNQSPATGGLAMYQLVSALIAAGWTKAADSDGTTYSATGAQVTSGNTGTNGLNNSNAWVRLKAPAVNQGSVANQQREITIQRGSSSTVWRIKYSASAGFTAGSPAAAVTPANTTDELVAHGAGTDASPTFSTFFAGDATYRTHIVCGGAAENYAFYFAVVTIGTGTPTIQRLLMLDPMQSGSFPTTDPDPAVFVATTAFTSVTLTGSSSTIANATNPCGARAWLGATGTAPEILTTGSNNNNVGYAVIGQFGGTSNLGINPFTGKLDFADVPIYRPGGSTPSPNGWKGKSTLVKWGSTPKANLDTATISTTKDRIYLDGGWFPWNGADPLY